jgi:hypothetical protein
LRVSTCLSTGWRTNWSVPTIQSECNRLYGKSTERGDVPIDRSRHGGGLLENGLGRLDDNGLVRSGPRHIDYTAERTYRGPQRLSGGPSHRGGGIGALDGRGLLGRSRSDRDGLLGGSCSNGRSRHGHPAFG